ncbi:hypothetical protein J2X20_002445 [Pelomonas saccharophila]|uniref:Uncharacterized protein n=1 Tax=Roseateles saccharophilus TaxID=304 RepID=A0ABU1YPB3_ROSSA|nr:hypothetical protein [Roseateles saccharophilus]
MRCANATFERLPIPAGKTSPGLWIRHQIGAGLSRALGTPP